MTDYTKTKGDEEEGGRQHREGRLRRAGRALYAIPGGIFAIAGYVGSTARKVTPMLYVTNTSNDLSAMPLNTPETFTSQAAGTCSVTNLGGGSWQVGSQVVHEAANGIIWAGPGGKGCNGMAFVDTGSTIFGNPIVQVWGVIPPQHYIDYTVVGYAAALVAVGMAVALAVRHYRQKWAVEKYLRDA